MTAFVTALFAEGRTDERFLPRIIQRTAAELLARHSRQTVDVLEPTLLEPDEKLTRGDAMLAVARKAAGYHVLFVHADADASTRDAAYTERFFSGREQIDAAEKRGEKICSDIVPVIPIQAVEAWLLADAQALISVIGTKLSGTQLGIPSRGHEIERIADPKGKLTDILQRAMAQRSRRRRDLPIGELYGPLADRILLKDLSHLSAYEQFSRDLLAVLGQLSFIR